MLVGCSNKVCWTSIGVGIGQVYGVGRFDRREDCEDWEEEEEGDEEVDES